MGGVPATSSSGMGGAPHTISSGMGGALHTSSSGAGGAGVCDGGIFCIGSCIVEDSANCGWCGHSCGNAPCIAGLCPVTPIAGPFQVVGALAATPASPGVYWAAGTVLGSAGTGSVMMAATMSPAAGLAVSADGTRVYVDDVDGLDVWTLSSTMTTPILAGSASMPGVVVAPTSAVVGWMDGTTLHLTPVAMSAADKPYPNMANVLALDGSDVWMFDTQSSQLQVVDASNLAAGPSGFGVTPTQGVKLMVADGNANGYLYVVWGDDTLHRIGKSGGSWDDFGVPAGGAIVGATGLVLSPEGDLFVLQTGASCSGSMDDGLLRHFNWTTHEVDVVAKALTCPANLVEDNKDLYFTAIDGNQATVFGVAR
jgi:hypothetical protein